MNSYELMFHEAHGAIDDKEHIKNATWWAVIIYKFKDRDEDI